MLNVIYYSWLCFPISLNLHAVLINANNKLVCQSVSAQLGQTYSSDRPSWTTDTVYIIQT